MRRTPIATLLALVTAATLASPARAGGQDIGELIGEVGSENAKLYVGPLARGLGHALTAGLVSSADPHGALGFSVGVRAMGARFPSEDERFTVVLPTSVTFTHPVFGSRTYQNPYRVSTSDGRSPTVAGDGNGAQLIPQGQYATDLATAGRSGTIDLPDGLDFPVAPFAVIDAAVGIGLGTQVMARIIPTLDMGKLVGVDEVGEISAFGVGVMHNLTQWLPIPTPFWDLSIAAGLQKAEAGSYLEASSNTIGLVGSAGLGPLSIYAHAASYKASLDFDYTVVNPNNANPALPPNGTQLAFEEEVERTQRLAVGAQLDLILIKLSAEYGLGDYETISLRAAVGLR